MSKYLDIATKKRELFPGANSPQQPRKSVEQLKAEFDASQKRRKEEIRNPLALKVQEKLSEKLGNGLGAQLAGGFAGGLVKGIERPVRFLMGSGYGIAQGVKGAMGDKEAASMFNQNINPFMTEEDMRRMKDPRDNTIALEKGTQMAGDVIPYILPGGTSMKARAGFGAASGFASGMAEPEKDLRSVATSTAMGAGTGLFMGGVSKAFDKLRSIGKKSINLRSGATPQLEAPQEQLKLPAGNDAYIKDSAGKLVYNAAKGADADYNVFKDMPEDNMLKQVMRDKYPNDPRFNPSKEMVPTNPAIEGEVVDKTGLVRTATQKAGNEIIDAVDNITYKRNPIKDALTGFKTQLSKFGENGKKLSQLLDSYENTSAVKASTALNKFKAVWDKLKTQKSNSPATEGAAKNDNEAVINYLLDVYNGRTPRGVTPEQRAVAESFFRDVTAEPSSLAGKLGLTIDGKPLGKPRPFVPLIPKDINKFKQAHLERLIKQGMTEQKANATISQIIDEMFNPATKVNARRFPGFENRRFFEPQSWQDLVDYGYESDIGKIAESWANRAWKRVEGIQHFGGTKYEGLNSVLNDLQKQGADPRDIEYIKKSFITFLEGRPLEGPEYEKMISTIKDIGALKLSPSSGIKQPLSLAQNFAIVGPKKSLKTLAKLVVGKVSPEEKRVINNAGLILEDRFDTGLMNRSSIVTGAENAKQLGSQLMSKELGFGDKVSATIRSLSRLNFKLTGIKPLDSGIRKLSGYSGYEWIKDSVNDLASGAVKGNKANALIEELNMFAFPNKNELLSAIDNGGQLTDEQLSKAIHHFVKKTQFGVSRAELPASWSNSPIGEVVTTLRSYGFEQAQFVGRLWELGKKTGNWGPLSTYLASATAIGYGVKEVNDKLMKSITGKDNKEDAVSYIGDLAGQAMLGVYWDTLKYSTFATGAAGLFGGPAGGELVDVMNTATTTANNLRSGKQDPTKELRSFLAKRTVGKVPYIGPKAVEAIKGGRRSTKSSKKKTRY